MAFDFAQFVERFCPEGGCMACGGCSLQMREQIESSPNYRDDPAIRHTQYKPADAPHEVRSLLYQTWEAAYLTGGKLATPTVVTYSFANGPSNYTGSVSGAPWNTTGHWIEYWDSIKQAIHTAAAAHSRATGIELIYVAEPDAAQINWRFEEADTDQPGAVMAPGPTALNSDIWINARFEHKYKSMDFSPGTEGFQFLLHEFGHALGMNHPFAGKYQLPEWQQNREWTVMSHTLDPLGGIRPEGLRPLDIQALAYIYGTAAQQAAMSVQWSQLTGGGLISRGSTGAETIIGTAANDWIVGGGGDDWLHGGGGDDFLDASGGRVTALGGSGTDTLIIGVDRATAFTTLTYRANTLQTNDPYGFEGVVHGAGGEITFTGIERIRFDDGTLTLHDGTWSPDPNLSVIERLYWIALGRAPLPNETRAASEAMDINGTQLSDIAMTILKTIEWSQATTNQTLSQTAMHIAERAYSARPDPSIVLDFSRTLNEGVSASAKLLSRLADWQGHSKITGWFSSPLQNLSVGLVPDLDVKSIADSQISQIRSIALISQGYHLHTARNEFDDREILVSSFHDEAHTLTSWSSTARSASGILHTSESLIKFENLEAIHFIDGTYYFGRDTLASLLTRIHLIATGQSPSKEMLSKEMWAIQRGETTPLLIAQGLVRSTAFEDIFGTLSGSSIEDAHNRREGFIYQVWNRGVGHTASKENEAVWRDILINHGHALSGFLIDYLARQDSSKNNWAAYTDRGIFVENNVSSHLSLIHFIANKVLPTKLELNDMLKTILSNETNVIEIISKVANKYFSEKETPLNQKVGEIFSFDHFIFSSQDKIQNLLSNIQDGSLSVEQILQNSANDPGVYASWASFGKITRDKSIAQDLFSLSSHLWSTYSSQVDNDKGFDPIFYLNINKDVRGSTIDPIRHYIMHGESEGRRPNMVFDPSDYIRANKDVSEASINALDHFLKFGWREGRDPSRDFDIQAYLGKNPDVASAGINPMVHYINWGITEGRTILPAIGSEITQDGFDSAFYLMAYPDVSDAGVDPEAHYRNMGWKEGRDPNAYFSTAGYLKINQDVWSADVNPLEHYFNYGWKEGRNASSIFDPKSYLFYYSDVANAGINPLVHFLHYGHFEGREIFTSNILG